MIDFLAILLFPDSPGKKHYLLKGNPKLTLDGLSRLRYTREILDVYCVIRREYFAMIPLWNEPAQRGCVEDQSIADEMQIVKKCVANEIVRIIEVPCLSPESHWN